MFVSTEDATQKILNKKKRVEKTDHKLGITNCTESHTKKCTAHLVTNMGRKRTIDS